MLTSSTTVPWSSVNRQPDSSGQWSVVSFTSNAVVVDVAPSRVSCLTCDRLTPLREVNVALHVVETSTSPKSMKTVESTAKVPTHITSVVSMPSPKSMVAETSVSLPRLVRSMPTAASSPHVDCKPSRSIHAAGPSASLSHPDKAA